MCRVREAEVLRPKWSIFIKPLPSGILVEEEVERLQEPEVVDYSKEAVSSRYNGTETHMNSETDRTHRICAGSNREGEVSTTFQP